jgi:5-methylcytosine-specific restriction endonuclease McrA
VETLVLSASYEPIATIPWFEAFCQILKGSAKMVHEYPENPIQAGAKTYPRPSVIQQKKYVKPRKIVRFSRENVWLRDNGKCQYCAKQCGRLNFTYDHVIPKSQGGKTTWENVVVACTPCNQLKSGRTPKEAGMPLLSVPAIPKSLGAYRRTFKVRKNIPESWGWYLNQTGSGEVYWNVELIQD